MMTRKRYRDSMIQGVEGTSSNNQAAPEISNLTNLNSMKCPIKVKIKETLDNLYKGKMEIKISSSDLENILSETFRSFFIKQERSDYISQVEQFPSSVENPVPYKKPFISKGTEQRFIGKPDPNIRTLNLPGPSTFYSSASTGKTVGYMINELMPSGSKFAECQQEINDTFQGKIMNIKKDEIMNNKTKEIPNIAQERSNEQFESRIHLNHELDCKLHLSQVICPDRLKISEIQNYRQSNSDLFSNLPKYPPSRSYPPNVKRPPTLFLQAKQSKDKIIVVWNLRSGDQQPENIHKYQIFCFEQKIELKNKSFESHSWWNRLGDMMGLSLPMACYLEASPGELVPGTKYFFTVRAVDMQNQKGDFSDPVCVICGATK